MFKTRGLAPFLTLVVITILIASVAFAQETTGGLQGVVKDQNGAVVSKAQVELTGTTLVGTKKLDTDSSGYYRFANLPPGVYSLTVKAQGFATLKRDGITLEVGHLPTLDLQLKVGGAETVVEVTGEAPVIDVTTTRTLTNITQEEVQDIPHGRSYQSVIQFAPSARNEPLAGSAVTAQSSGGTGNGGNSPGNGGNGQTYGFSVGGGADSENSYLVEGQETASPIGGTAHTNVPFEFIEEVQIKSSGIEAEHGGGLGGVINVILKKGSNDWHGELGLSFENNLFNATAGDVASGAYVRYDPNGVQTQPSGWTYSRTMDTPVQLYQPQKDTYKTVLPSFRIGGSLIKDRLFAVVGFAPEYFTRTRIVDFGGSFGEQQFGRDRQTYYTYGRLDFRATSKLNLFASWISQYQRETGASLPYAESVNNLYNASSASPLTNFARGVGFAAPNQTMNFGADFTVTPQLVATTRFGYFFENYHDFGYPNGTIFNWESNGKSLYPGTQLAYTTGTTSALLNQDFTDKDADKHWQFDQDVAWFKSGWFGTHNFKFGYQYNRSQNDIYQLNNGPQVRLYLGTATSPNDSNNFGDGTYGQMEVFDAGTGGMVYSYNHAFFAQDAWTIGHGVTINAGIRFEDENVPLSSYAKEIGTLPLTFGWGDKIAPRIGAAWDVYRNGKLKIFGSYGAFYDMMKLNLAISSFGGQWWNSCFYQLNNPNLALIAAAANSAGRYCLGNDQNTPALGNYYTTVVGSNGPANTFSGNVNFREPVPGMSYFAAGLKPYRQHETVFGADYQLKKDLALEVRWDRRRLDHAIEDTAIAVVDGSEEWQVVNPGEGINAISACSTCPMNIKPARSYDGLEFRLNKSMSNHWGGMFSYTYSKLRGNYSGLTNTDQTDGGGGRNSPNNGRSFDEPYFQFNAYGTSSSGVLATDRPNTFKGMAYYELKEGKRSSTTFGIFQVAYQGTPLSTYIDVGGGGGAYGVYPEGRGKWADITQDASTGMLTVTGVRDRRTPWYNQSDLNFKQEFKTNKNNERQSIAFEATMSNLFNQHAPLVYGSQVNSRTGGRYLLPGGKYLYGADTLNSYSLYEHAYDWKTLLNTNYGNDTVGTTVVNSAKPIIFNNQYGKALAWQQGRNIRFSLRYKF